MLTGIALSLAVAGSIHVCPPEAAMSPSVQEPWKDRSPHAVGHVTLRGVRLQYLDWGGNGPAIVFLAGMGSCAHFADDLAPELTDRFRVLAVTRRGHGKSDWPESGYDLPTLVEDLRLFLDAKGIKQAILAGHSMGGDEATVFASKYPDRVIKVVYLDGDFNRSLEFDAQVKREHPVDHAKNPFPPRMEAMPMAPDTPFSDFRKWFEENLGFWTNAVEANVRETMGVEGEKLTGKPGMAPKFGSEAIKSAQESPPDFSQVKAPVLSLVAVRRNHPFVPASASEEEKARAQAFIDQLARVRLAHVESMRRAIPGAKVVLIDGDHPSFFITKRKEVIREMRAFLSKE